MASKKEKTDRYISYMLAKRDEFIDKLVRVGAKLLVMNDDDYDLEAFVKAFVPSTNFLKNKIYEEARESQLSLSPSKAEASCEKKDSFDAQLLEALRTQFLDFEKDFKELRKIPEPDEDECEPEPPKEASKRSKTPKKCSDHACDSHSLTQVINPGEMSKIFVQKSRIDVINSKLDNPDFNDDNLETIYIYRSKKG